MEEIRKKIESGKPLTPSEVSQFYKGYNEEHGTLERHDGSMAKIVNLNEQWTSDKTDVQVQKSVSIDTSEKVAEPKKEK